MVIGVVLETAKRFVRIGDLDQVPRHIVLEQRFSTSRIGDLGHPHPAAGETGVVEHRLQTHRIDNLFDEDYELVYGYNTPGLSVFVGANYKLPE